MADMTTGSFGGRKEAEGSALLAGADKVALTYMAVQLSEMGFNVAIAQDRVDALNTLHDNPGAVDFVMLDCAPGRRESRDLLDAIKNNPQLRSIPVIMHASADNAEDMGDYLDRGAFYYLARPVAAETLFSLLRAAVRRRREIIMFAPLAMRHQKALALMDTARFTFRTLREAEALSAFLSGMFPDPERVVSGLAELMTNAVEHGNLEIGHEEKAQLLSTGAWREEVERRLNEEPYRERVATAVLTRKEDGIYVQIADQGHGFPWRNFMSIEPDRAAERNGRGIAHAQALCFDRLIYNQEGNKAVAYVRN